MSHREIKKGLAPRTTDWREIVATLPSLADVLPQFPVDLLVDNEVLSSCIANPSKKNPAQIFDVLSDSISPYYIRSVSASLNGENLSDWQRQDIDRIHRTIHTAFTVSCTQEIGEALVKRRADNTVWQYTLAGRILGIPKIPRISPAKARLFYAVDLNTSLGWEPRICEPIRQFLLDPKLHHKFQYHPSSQDASYHNDPYYTMSRALVQGYAQGDKQAVSVVNEVLEQGPAAAKSGLLYCFYTIGIGYLRHEVGKIAQQDPHRALERWSELIDAYDTMAISILEASDSSLLAGVDLAALSSVSTYYFRRVQGNPEFAASYPLENAYDHFGERALQSLALSLGKLPSVPNLNSSEAVLRQESFVHVETQVLQNLMHHRFANVQAEAVRTFARALHDHGHYRREDRVIVVDALVKRIEGLIHTEPHHPAVKEIVEVLGAEESRYGTRRLREFLLDTSIDYSVRWRIVELLSSTGVMAEGLPNLLPRAGRLIPAVDQARKQQLVDAIASLLAHHMQVFPAIVRDVASGARPEQLRQRFEAYLAEIGKTPAGLLPQDIAGDSRLTEYVWVFLQPEVVYSRELTFKKFSHVGEAIARMSEGSDDQLVLGVLRQRWAQKNADSAQEWENNYIHGFTPLPITYESRSTNQAEVSRQACEAVAAHLPTMIKLFVLTEVIETLEQEINGKYPLPEGELPSQMQNIYALRGKAKTQLWQRINDVLSTKIGVDEQLQLGDISGVIEDSNYLHQLEATVIVSSISV